MSDKKDLNKKIRSIWINTFVRWEWCDGELVEVNKEGYYYEGPVSKAHNAAEVDWIDASLRVYDAAYPSATEVYNYPITGTDLWLPAVEVDGASNELDYYGYYIGVGVEEVNGGDQSNQDWQLEQQVSGLAWAAVDAVTSNYWMHLISDTTYHTDGDDVPQTITSGTYVTDNNSYSIGSNPSNTYTHTANSKSEVVWLISLANCYSQKPGNNVIARWRVVSDNASMTASPTISDNGIAFLLYWYNLPELRDYRFYEDTASLADPVTSQNTTATLDIGTTYHLRSGGFYNDSNVSTFYKTISNQYLHWECRLNSGSWVEVGSAGAPVVFETSTNYSHWAAITTPTLYDASGTGNLQGRIWGQADESVLIATNQSVSKSSTASYIELGLNFSLDGTYVSDADTVEIRYVTYSDSNNGSVTDYTNPTTYTRVATITANLGTTTVTKTASANAFLKALGLTETTTANALLQVPGNLRTSSADALLIKNILKTASADAFIKALAQTETASADAFLKALGLTDTASADAYLSLRYTKTATVNSVLRIVGLMKSADVDAFLQTAGLEKTATIDALLQKLFEKTATIDAYFSQAGLTLTANTNAVLSSFNELTASVNAQLVAPIGIGATVDAYLTKDPVLDQTNSGIFTVGPDSQITEITSGTLNCFTNVVKFMAVFQVQETGGGSSTTGETQLALQYRINTGSWVYITNASTDAFKYSPGAQPWPGKRHGDPLTSAYLTGGTGTFYDGYFCTYHPGFVPQTLPSGIGANGHTEVAFYLEPNPPYFVNNDTVEFRVVYAGDVVLDSYTDTLSFTINENNPSAALLQRSYRIYADDDVWGSSTPLAAKDTAYTLPTDTGLYRFQFNITYENQALASTNYYAHLVYTSLRAYIDGASGVTVSNNNNTDWIYYTGEDVAATNLIDTNLITTVALDPDPSITDTWSREVVMDQTGNSFVIAHMPPETECDIVFGITINASLLTPGDTITVHYEAPYDTLTGSSTITLYVPSTVTKTALANAFLQKNQIKTALVNAILNSSGNLTADANAMVQKLGQLEITSLNALLQIAEQTESATANGLLRLLANLETATANAILQKTFEKNTSVSAWLQTAGITKTAVADALLKALGFSETANADAFLQLTSSLNTDANAFLFGADILKSANVSAVLQGDGAFWLTDVDALLQTLGNISTTDVNAILLLNSLKTATISAILYKIFEHSTDLDAYLQLQDNIQGFIADAYLSGTVTTEADVNAVLQKTFNLSSDLDAILSIGYLQSGEIDAILKGTVSKDTSVSAYLAPAPGVWNERQEQTSSWDEDTGTSSGWTEDSPASSDWN